ncbi:TolC family protein [Alcanivorax sp. JB21]|uniref:TolC family protein n=1 Tax=Alcanivorax limicola TaxID=2874102 RepID=UPI001CBE582A|nr:TolC family protein [Alcanivorax limicola]MBZ2189331.1 TolC family protein [Alcanivorax limicola]
MKSYSPAGLVWLLLPWLAACAAAPPDDGKARINEALAARGVVAESAMHASTPVQGTLTRADAVLHALTRNPNVQLEYQRLDLAAADIVAASQLSNPRLSLSWLRPEGGGGNETGIGIAQNFAGLLLRPALREQADARYEAGLLRAEAAIHHLAADTESAWYALVAAEQTLQVQELVARAAMLAAELGDRFREAGNMNALTVSTLHAEAAEARLALVAARRARDRARNELASLMDAAPATNDAAMNWTVPTLLPLPPADMPPVAALIDTALVRRPDILAAQADEAWLEDNLALVNRYRWLGDLEVGVRHEREGDGTRLTGPTLGLALPLFHRNQAGLLTARAELGRARLSREQLRQETGHTIAQLHQELHWLRESLAVREDALLPARAQVVARRQERVNYMFDGIFDLLAAKQDELLAWRAQVATLADYWQVHTRLVLAVGGEWEGSERDAQAEAAVLDTRRLEHDAAAATHEDHDHHEHHNHDHHNHHQGGHH